jgi:hypothetical protein
MMETFPLCGEARHEAPVRRLIDGCVDFVRRHLAPERLAGVILTGSFARGEGSVLPVGGRLRVLGDIEFFVVLSHPADYRRLRAEMAGWGPMAAAELAGGGVDADLEFGPVHVRYLYRARPSIFVYDLQHHGKVLLGPRDLLAHMPPLSADGIPREDALRLLLNRTIEQLDAYGRMATLGADELLGVAYHRLKIVLDLAGSALAFSGLHSASYAERPARLARLIRETPSLARRLPPAFERELAEATLAKLAPEEHDDFADGGGSLEERRQALRARITAAVPAMTGLLAWELGELLGAGGELPELLARYLRAQSLSRRAWDWVKLLVNPLPAPLPLSLPAALRLFWTSTPRALIYAAGALAYRDLVAPPRRDLVAPPRRDLVAPPRRDLIAAPASSLAPAGLLPLARSARPRDPDAHRRAVVALWRWCVRNS